MSYDLEIIKRKSDNKALIDLINDSCDVHNIFDGEVVVDVGYGYEIGCDYGAWSEQSKYQKTNELDNYSDEEYVKLKNKLISLL